MAFGTDISVTDQAVALGNNVGALGYGSIAIGTDDFMNAEGKTLLGTDFGSFKGFDLGKALSKDGKGFVNEYEGKHYRSTIAKGTGATVIGPEALANTVATSVGAASTATGIGSFAGGFRATADGRNSIAMSDLSLAYGKGSVAIGERSLAGSTDINSVVKSDEERFSTAVGANAVAAAKQSTALGYNAHALELDSLAINNGATAFSKESIAIGKDSVAGGAGKDTPTPGALEAIAIGSGAIAQEVQGIAIGSGAVSRGSQGTAIGYNAHALEQDSLAINNGATAFSKESIAIGNDAVAGGIDKNKATTGARRAVAIGGGAVAKDYQGTAIGYKAEAKNTGDVAIGAMSKTPDTIKYTESYNINGEDRTFTGGKNISVMGVASIGDTKSRILTGVAAGQISTVSTDAVNGSQLHRVIEEINKGVVFTDSYGGSATNRFGKNNTVATGDAVTDGDFTGKNLKAVVAAGDAGETTIKLMMNKSPEFENITASKISFGAGGPSITNAGIDAGGKVITNVGDGNIAAGSKDAVNAGQLYNVQTKVDAGWNAKLDNGTGATLLKNVKPDANDLVFKAGNNIELTQGDGGELVIGAKADLKFDKTTIAEGTPNATTMDENGIKVGTAADDTQINKDGLAVGGENGSKVGKDAVSVGGPDGSKMDKDSVSVGGPDGSKMDKDSVSVGGPNGSKMDKDSMSVGGPNGSKMDKDSMSVGGENGSKMDKDSVSVGGPNGAKMDKDGFTIGTTKIEKDGITSDKATIGGNTTVNKDGINTNNVTSDKATIGGNTTITNDGITTNKISFGEGGPSITKDGIDAGGKVISNVGDGNIAAGSKDAVNAGQLFDVKETAEAAKNAIDNAKFGLADTKGNKIETGLNNTISVVAGEAKAGANYSVDNLTTVVKDGKLEIQMTDRPDFGGVTINKDGSGRITGVANAVEDGDAVNKKQMDDAIKEASSKVSAGDNNVDVKLDTTGDIKDYKVSLKDDLTLGKDAEKQVSIKGTEGKITAGGVAIDGVNGKINGLKNTTWNGTTSDRGTAATEGQLSDVDTKVEAGWIAQVNGVDAKNVKPSDNKLNFANGSNIEITAGQDGSVKVSTAKDVSFDKVQVGGVSINKDTGIDAGGMKITNIAAGTEAGDAANYGQVKEVSDRVDNLGNAVNRVSNEVQDVGAASAALAGLKPMGYDPMRKTQMMAGVGDYRGNMAVALGIVHYSNEDLMWHVGTSLGASHNMISGGLTFKFGNTKETDKLPARYRKGPMTSVYVLQTEVATLTKQNEYLLKDNQTMKQDNEALKRDNEQLKKDNAETKAKLAMIMAKLGLK